MGLLKVYPATLDSNPDYKSYWVESASLLKYHDAKVLMETLVAEMNKM